MTKATRARRHSAQPDRPRRRRLPLSTTALALLLLAACQADDSGLYGLDDMRDLSVRATERDRVLIRYRPPVENAYVGPGARVEYNAEAIEIRFPRCEICAHCPTDHKIAPASTQPAILHLETKGRVIYVVDGAGRHRIFPR